MPYFKHCISTRYGISERCYKGELLIAGARQGNKFISNMCRDISCLIIKQLEMQNLGAYFLSLVTLASIVCASVLFVDDTDLSAQGRNVVKTHAVHVGFMQHAL